MNENASLYSNHRRLQIDDNAKFLTLMVPKMNWSKIFEDIVMDVGCGPGDSTLQQLLPNLPEVRKIVAVDVLSSMIEYAKTNNAHPKIEYFKANIEDRADLQPWTGRITKIFSFYCLHWVTRQTESFGNIYVLLKPGGEAALLFVTKSIFYHSYEALLNSSKWNKYFQEVEKHIPESNFMADCSSHYIEIFGKIGFDVLVFEVEQKSFTFQDDQECKNVLASLCNLLNYVPEDLKEEFKNDFFEEFLKYSPKRSDGKPTLLYTAVSILLRKPKEG